MYVCYERSGAYFNAKELDRWGEQYVDEAHCESREIVTNKAQ